jgi:hypothetical protein
VTGAVVVAFPGCALPDPEAEVTEPEVTEPTPEEDEAWEQRRDEWVSDFRAYAEDLEDTSPEEFMRVLNGLARRMDEFLSSG